MPQIRPSQLCATLAAMFAMVALAVLPLSHAHRTASGHTLVHSHVAPEPADHVGMVDGGDHHDAESLAHSFTVEPTLRLDAPALIAALVLVPPAEPSVGYVEPAVPRPTHGPPIRVISLRAPPA